MLYAVFGDGSFRSYVLETLEEVQKWTGHKQPVGSQTFIEENLGEKINNTFQHNNLITNYLLVSGSWDGSFCLWDGSKLQQTEQKFRYSTQVCYLNNFVVVGSGDFSLSIYTIKYDTETHIPQLILFKRIEKAHDHVIRKIIPFNTERFITCGNDGVFNQWDLTGCRLSSNKLFFATDTNSEFVHDMVFISNCKCICVFFLIVVH